LVINVVVKSQAGAKPGIVVANDLSARRIAEARDGDGIGAEAGTAGVHSGRFRVE